MMLFSFLPDLMNSITFFSCSFQLTQADIARTAAWKFQSLTTFRRCDLGFRGYGLEQWLCEGSQGVRLTDDSHSLSVLHPPTPGAATRLH